MDPCVWGPPLWSLLHGAAQAQPLRAEAPVRDAIMAMRCVLPCKHCRVSLRRFWEAVSGACFEDPFDLVWLLHNSVNRKLGKPELTHERARRVWSNSVHEPVSALRLAEALVIVDANLATRALGRERRAVLRCYEQWWDAVARLCALVPMLQRTGRLMRRRAQRVTARTAMRRSNSLRTALLRDAGRVDLALTPAQAAARARKCRKAPARPRARKG